MSSTDGLTPKQRAWLRSRARTLKPGLSIGKSGVTAATAREVAALLERHELLKIKVLEAAPENADEAGAALMQLLSGAHLVQVIGRTVVLYRPHPDRPQIALPA